MNEQRRGTTEIAVPLNEMSPRERLRLTRLARELRLTDQILSTDMDTVSVEAGGPAPAWTTLEGDKVSFAYNKMPAPDHRAAVAVWLGTNAHELGHVLFSPRRDSMLMYRVIESDRTFLPGIAQLHNIVEDQRQERLLLARFSPWTGYLTAALSHHLVANEDTSWLLMAGRTWLPDDVRTTAKATMVARRGQHDVDAVTRIVGEYQKLVDPGDTDGEEAWELLQELHALFVDDTNELPPSTCTVIEGGEPDTSDPDEDAPETADEREARDGEGDADVDDDAAADDGEGDGSGGDADDDSGEGKGKGEGDADADVDAPSGKGAGKDPGRKAPESPIDKMRKALKEGAKRQIESDADAKSDLDSVIDAVEYGRPGDEPQGAQREGRYEEASDAARRLHREVADALLDLKDESEPGWMKRVDSGRLNVRRLLDPNTDADEMFDRYEPGMMDASELEVALLLDVSGSMSGERIALAEAAWAIRQSVDDLEGSCTVITWDSGPHRILASPSERPDGRMFIPETGGGTVPTTALAEAYQLLANSTARNRLMVILTDGDWYSSDNSIAAMNEADVVTVCALLGYSAGENIHGCRYGARIDDARELAVLFRRIASERIQAWR